MEVDKRKDVDKVKVKELVEEDIADQLHPSLLKFSPPDIGILETHEEQDLLMGSRNWLFFFLHPSMVDEELLRAKVRQKLVLYFPKEINDFDTNKSLCGSSIDRTDTIHHLPNQTYLQFNPDAELFVELPF